MKKIYLSIIMAVYTVVTFAQAGIISTVAGDGTHGYSGDGGQATAAELYSPFGAAFDASGNLYIADQYNSLIRKVNTSGIISTVAGNYTVATGYSGDGGAATAASIQKPHSLTFDASGSLYIADWGNNVIRKVNTNGIISTFAGNGAANYSGDGGQATAAALHYPWGITFDASGNLYIAEQANNVIRKVNTSGIISTVAGIGTAGGSYSGNGGPATAAKLNTPLGVAFDANGNLYIADNGNYVVRMVNTSGIISTFAGTTATGYAGDGGMATAAQFNSPVDVTFDASGSLYIADTYNDVIRIVNTSGIISTFAGNAAAGYSGDGGQATAAELHSPFGVAFDATGNFYIADATNNCIRKVCLNSCTTTGIEQHNTSSNISIYPNPATGMLNVEGLMLNDNISICDVLGNEVIATKEKQIDISSLANGIYFIKTTQGTQKLIKQ